MAYSNWQIRILRDALRRYRQFTSDETGRSLTWGEVAGKIFATTDVEIVPERLRQFVEGVSKKSGDTRFTIPLPERLEAIADFLMDPEVDALSPEELSGDHRPGYQAPLYLLQYLRQTFDNEIVFPPHGFAGQFFASREGENGEEHIEISFDNIGDEGLIEVSEKRVFVSEENEEPTAKGKRSHGWAILTPEDNLLIFMKQEPYGRNHYYATVGLEEDFWSNPKVGRLALVQHDYPFELSYGDDTEGQSAISVELTRNVLLFKRPLPGESGGS